MTPGYFSRIQDLQAPDFLGARSNGRWGAGKLSYGTPPAELFLRRHIATFVVIRDSKILLNVKIKIEGRYPLKNKYKQINCA